VSQFFAVPEETEADLVEDLLRPERVSWFDEDEYDFEDVC
jgi:hypothetical protein